MRSIKRALNKACARKQNIQMRLFVLIPTSVLLCRNERAEKRLLIWKADALLRRWCRFRESRLVENEMEDNLNFPSLIGFLYGCEIEFSPLGNFLFFPPILGTKIQMLSSSLFHIRHFILREDLLFPHPDKKKKTGSILWLDSILIEFLPIQF